MNDVTRTEFNGLGDRVNVLDKKFYGCKEKKENQIVNLEADNVEHKKDITRIFQSQEELKIQFAASSNKVIGAVAVIVFVLSFLSAIVQHYLTKGVG